jgi:putative photosynthetic complex assembly protein
VRAALPSADIARDVTARDVPARDVHDAIPRAAHDVIPRAAHDVIPRAALWGAGAVLVLTLAGAGLVRWTTRGDAPPAYTATVAQRALHFNDRADGGIAIVDAASGATIDSAHGEQGFLRGTLRSLSRERKRRGIGSGEPLQLIARADGRLTLHDGATGQHIDLESFGPTNAAVFARWLPPGTAGATP